MKYKSYQIVKTWQQTSDTFDQNANETEYNTCSNILLALVVRTDDFRIVSCTRDPSVRRFVVSFLIAYSREGNIRKDITVLVYVYATCSNYTGLHLITQGCKRRLSETSSGTENELELWKDNSMEKRRYNTTVGCLKGPVPPLNQIWMIFGL